MALGSPSASTAAKLVYWTGADADSSSSGSSPATSGSAGEGQTSGRDHDGRSMYVTVFEGASRDLSLPRVAYAPNVAQTCSRRLSRRKASCSPKKNLTALWLGTSCPVRGRAFPPVVRLNSCDGLRQREVPFLSTQPAQGRDVVQIFGPQI